MISNLGYKKNLFILPFDHRSSFIELFGFTNPDLSYGEKEIITKAKEIIYAAFKNAVEQEIPKEQAVILIDEEYGDKIIRDAISQGYNVILTTEKSGQKEFTFEYEDNFAKHIEKYELGKALHLLYEFFWHKYADIYIETAKKQLTNEKSKAGTKKTLLKVHTDLLKMLHPFLPFVTEEIWTTFGKLNGSKKLLIIEHWPN